MSLFVWLIVIIVVAVVVVVVFEFSGRFIPYQPPLISEKELEEQYTPTNPWGVNGGFDPPSVPVEGLAGRCNVYTFITDQNFTPAIINMASIQACVHPQTGSGLDQNDSVGGFFDPQSGFNSAGQRPPTCSSPLPGQTCVDVDQVFARKMTHTCQPNPTGWDIRTSGTCRQQDGKLVPPGTVEEYFTACDPPGVTNTGNVLNKCKGSLSLVILNADISKPGPSAFEDALCLVEPNYTLTPVVGGSPIIDFTSPLFLDKCDMIPSYRGFPKQLFRIERASFDGRSFRTNQNGSYGRIIHRPSGFHLAPKLNPGPGGPGSVNRLQPVVGDNVELYSPDVFEGIFPWYLVPHLQDPKWKPTDTVRLVSRSQLVYTPQAKLVPSEGDEAGLWEYLTSNHTTAISLSMDFSDSGTSVVAITRRFVFYDSNRTPPTNVPDLSKLSFAMYMDYAIAGIIVQDPLGFDFDGPFPMSV